VSPDGTTSAETDLGPELAGHPALLEIVRVATCLTQGEVEIVAFRDDRAHVVASFDRRVLQPRALAPLERQLRALTSGHLSHPSGLLIALRVGSHRLVGTLSARFDRRLDAATLDGLHSLGRLAAAVFDHGPPTGTDATFAGVVLDNLRDAVIVLDSGFQITYASPSTAGLIARTPTELVGTSGADLVHPDDLVVALDAFERIASGREVYRVLLRVQHGSGEWVRVEVTGRDLSWHEAVRGVVVSLRSADLDLELEDHLHAEQRFVRALVDQLDDGIVGTDPFGVPTVVNRVARDLYGAAPHVPAHQVDLDRVDFLDRNGRPVGLEHQPLTRALRGEAVRGEELSVIDGERNRRVVVVRSLPIPDDRGGLAGAVTIYRDVTDARLAERELRQRALHDQLTGLANRRLLQERILALQTDPPPGLLAACFVDLDRFKLINDTYGHRVGDAVVRVAALRLGSVLRPGDLLARLGGDEFVALLCGVGGRDEAVEIGHRLCNAFAAPVEIAGTVLKVDVSIGVATQPADAIDEDELLRCADIALYAAKGAGRNRVEYYDDALGQITERQHLEYELVRRALDHDRVVMHYQPVVRADDGRLAGFEALVRCLRDDGTLVGPQNFLDVAVSRGLIIELDRRGFELSCEALSVLRRRYPANGLIMACNFSGLTISQPSFPREVLATIGRYGLPPSALMIEITEISAFDIGPAALAGLHELRAAGVGLALDDFGTGYSSLAHLRSLPLDTVKVDRSFVTNLASDSPERSIAEAVVALAGTLKLAIVAEGVESDAQLEQARRMGFTFIQGFRYSAARTFDEVLDLLEAPERGWTRQGDEIGAAAPDPPVALAEQAGTDPAGTDPGSTDPVARAG